MGDFEDRIRQIKKQSDQKNLKDKEAIIRQQYNEQMFGTLQRDKSHKLNAAKIISVLLDELTAADKTITSKGSAYDTDPYFTVIRKNTEFHISIRIENGNVIIDAHGDYFSLEKLSTTVFIDRFDQNGIRKSAEEAIKNWYSYQLRRDG